MNSLLTASAASRRLFATCAALFAASVPVLAQVAAPEPSAPAKEGEVLELSVFRVSSTQDKGYIANTATPFKTKQQLIDIPQAITVVTRDMIEDIGGYDTSDIIIYGGAIPKYRSEAFSLRGSNTGVTYALIDGQIDRTIFMDPLFIDSYTIIRGPAALLYPNTALTGVINKTTRKPLPNALNTLSFRMTDYGLYRAELDSTGPLAKVGDGTLSYRVLAANQGGDSYWQNATDDRIVFHPSLQWENKDTSVLLAFDYNEIKRPSNPTGVFTPDGKVFTGNGRDMINLPPGAMETHVHEGVRAQLAHSFSTNWEVKVGLDYNLLRRHGSIVLPIGGVNYVDRTISYFNRRNQIDLDHYSVSMDFNGKYTLFGVPNQSTFGGVFTIQESVTKLWVNNDFYNGITAARIVRPLDNPSVNTLPVKPYDAYTGIPSTRSRVRSDLGNFYLQQVIDVLPDRLSLVGGYSLYSNETSNNLDITVRPAVAQIAKSFEPLHRYGLVFKPVKGVAIYAVQANTSLPPTTSKLANGGVVPPATGKGKEAGVKFDLFGGKLSSTIAAFDLETTGLTVFGGTLPDGSPYVIPVGLLSQKGFDADISWQITPEWQLVGTLYDGTVEDQNGQPVDDSYTQSWSLFTRYDFRSSTSLKGFSFGGGISRINGRVVSTAGLTFPVGVTKPTFMKVEPGTLVGVFANYALNKHWTFRLQCDNLLDETYAVGINAAYLVDPSLPRNFTLSAKYKF
ncbi:MAG: TonB-dependent receptor [Opitutaceae bacterium]|nr:TonB-dependent receptor [Opitutaceae bacterium]